MNRKTVSLRWKAARKYNGVEDSEALRAIRPSVWKFLDDLVRGRESVGGLPVGTPTLKRYPPKRSEPPQHVFVIYSIGRPAPTDPDRHADYFIEDFWPEGDSSSN